MTLQTPAIVWKAAVKTASINGWLRFYAYILLNSALFHFLRKQFSIKGYYESFQTKGGVSRALQCQGFGNVAVEQGKHFVVTATKATANDRTTQQIREHYEIEKELASRLRQASRVDRKGLYSTVYDELYRRVPTHPQLTRKASPQSSARAVASQMALLRRFLNPNRTFLEIGPGDCALSFEAAKFVKHVYAVDVSAEITKVSVSPPNFTLVLSNGSSIPVKTGTVDVAYSYQLIEHLHPEDAAEQVTGVFQTLKPGGMYLCVTPSRLGGPWDISRNFDNESTGFHLKEYTHSELIDLFKSAGFRRVQAYLGVRGNFVALPGWFVRSLENMVALLPQRGRSIFPLRLFFDIRLVGVK